MIIFFSLSDWERFGTQSPPGWPQADYPACPQALLTSQKHSRIFTQKMQGAPSLAWDWEADIVSHTIQGTYHAAHLQCLKTESADATMLLLGHCFNNLSHATYLQHLKKQTLPQFLLGSSLSLIHTVTYMHRLLHTMEFFWPRAYKTNSRSASPHSVYCVTGGCSVKRAAPVKGREKNVM